MCELLPNTVMHMMCLHQLGNEVLVFSFIVCVLLYVHCYLHNGTLSHMMKTVNVKSSLLWYAYRCIWSDKYCIPPCDAVVFGVQFPIACPPGSYCQTDYLVSPTGP